MKYFKNDNKENIDSHSALDVSLEFVLSEIDRFPTEDETEGCFIGIINNNDETIQFIRFSENEWFLDFPVLKEGLYSHSLQCDNLTTQEVKNIIRKFFNETAEWMKLVNLT